MTEQWKQITKEPRYEISTLGRVRNIETEHIKSLRLDQGGYERVTLYPSGKTYHIHRLIALEFIPNPLSKDEVNHKDNIRHNNLIENLEWTTKSENSIHRIKTGIVINIDGSKNPQSKLTEKQAYDIKYNHHELSNVKVAKMYPISANTVRRIRKHELWKHI